MNKKELVQNGVLSLVLLAGVAVLMGYRIFVTSGVSYQIERSANSTTISRSTSDFKFANLGSFTSQLRVFGFKANPLGVNNRDDYVANFGIPLLPTHIIVATNLHKARTIALEDHCEKRAADGASFIPAIAENVSVKSRLDSIARKSGKVCIELEGDLLSFQAWLINGRPQDSAKISRMTKISGGVNFAQPVLVKQIREVGCNW